ncbi:MAG: fibronectin type III domain-containing protein [Planctomycetaceae bacterium]|nr:fibronectin type III domain-containing protein [Planctomycetaceae bacterium]
MFNAFDFINKIFSNTQQSNAKRNRKKGRQARIEELEGREMLDGALGSIFAGAYMPDNNDDDIIVVAPPDFSNLPKITVSGTITADSQSAGPQAAGETANPWNLSITAGEIDDENGEIELTWNGLNKELGTHEYEIRISYDGFTTFTSLPPETAVEDGSTNKWSAIVTIDLVDDEDPDLGFSTDYTIRVVATSDAKITEENAELNVNYEVAVSQQATGNVILTITTATGQAATAFDGEDHFAVIKVDGKTRNVLIVPYDSEEPDTDSNAVFVKGEGVDTGVWTITILVEGENLKATDVEYIGMQKHTAVEGADEAESLVFENTLIVQLPASVEENDLPNTGATILYTVTEDGETETKKVALVIDTNAFWNSDDEHWTLQIDLGDATAIPAGAVVAFVGIEIAEPVTGMQVANLANKFAIAASAAEMTVTFDTEEADFFGDNMEDAGKFFLTYTVDGGADQVILLTADDLAVDYDDPTYTWTITVTIPNDGWADGIGASDIVFIGFEKVEEKVEIESEVVSTIEGKLVVEISATAANDKIGDPDDGKAIATDENEPAHQIGFTVGGTEYWYNIVSVDSGDKATSQGVTAAFDTDKWVITVDNINMAEGKIEYLGIREIALNDDATASETEQNNTFTVTIAIEELENDALENGMILQYMLADEEIRDAVLTVGDKGDPGVNAWSETVDGDTTWYVSLTVAGTGLETADFTYLAIVKATDNEEIEIAATDGIVIDPGTTDAQIVQFTTTGGAEEGFNTGDFQIGYTVDNQTYWVTLDKEVGFPNAVWSTDHWVFTLTIPAAIIVEPEVADIGFAGVRKIEIVEGTDNVTDAMSPDVDVNDFVYDGYNTLVTFTLDAANLKGETDLETGDMLIFQVGEAYYTVEIGIKPDNIMAMPNEPAVAEWTEGDTAGEGVWTITLNLEHGQLLANNQEPVALQGDLDEFAEITFVGIINKPVADDILDELDEDPEITVEKVEFTFAGAANLLYDTDFSQDELRYQIGYTVDGGDDIIWVDFTDLEGWSGLSGLFTKDDPLADADDAPGTWTFTLKAEDVANGKIEFAGVRVVEDTEAILDNDIDLENEVTGEDLGTIITVTIEDPLDFEPNKDYRLAYTVDSEPGYAALVFDGDGQNVVKIGDVYTITILLEGEDPEDIAFVGIEEVEMLAENAGPGTHDVVLEFDLKDEDSDLTGTSFNTGNFVITYTLGGELAWVPLVVATDGTFEDGNAFFANGTWTIRLTGEDVEGLDAGFEFEGIAGTVLDNAGTEDAPGTAGFGTAKEEMELQPELDTPFVIEWLAEDNTGTYEITFTIPGEPDDEVVTYTIEGLTVKDGDGDPVEETDVKAEFDAGKYTISINNLEAAIGEVDDEDNTSGWAFLVTDLAVTELGRVTNSNEIAANSDTPTISVVDGPMISGEEAEITIDFAIGASETAEGNWYIWYKAPEGVWTQYPGVEIAVEEGDAELPSVTLMLEEPRGTLVIVAQDDDGEPDAELRSNELQIHWRMTGPNVKTTFEYEGTDGERLEVEVEITHMNTDDIAAYIVTLYQHQRVQVEENTYEWRWIAVETKTILEPGTLETPLFSVSDLGLEPGNYRAGVVAVVSATGFAAYWADSEEKQSLPANVTVAAPEAEITAVELTGEPGNRGIKVTWNGEIDGSNGVVVYRVEVWLDDNFVTGSYWPFNPSGEYTWQSGNLPANVPTERYTVHVIAIGNEGDFYRNSTATETIVVPAPLAGPIDIGIGYEDSEGEIVVTWKVNPAAVAGSIEHYTVQLHEFVKPGEELVPVGTAEIVSSTTFSKTFDAEELGLFGRYYAVITAVAATEWFENTAVQSEEYAQVGEAVNSPTATLEWIEKNDTTGEGTLEVTLTAPEEGAEFIAGYVVQLYRNGEMVAEETVVLCGEGILFGTGEEGDPVLGRGEYHVVVYALAQARTEMMEDPMLDSEAIEYDAGTIWQEVAAPEVTDTVAKVVQTEDGAETVIEVTFKAPNDEDGILRYTLQLHDGTDLVGDPVEVELEGLSTYTIQVPYDATGSYRVIVTAVPDGDDHWTEAYDETPMVLAQPTGTIEVSGPAGAQIVTVTVTPPENTAGIANYQVELFRVNNAGDDVSVGSKNTNLGGIAVWDDNLERGVYYAVITAIPAASSTTHIASAPFRTESTEENIAEPVAAPANVQAEEDIENGTILVKWEAPTPTTGITGYRVALLEDGVEVEASGVLAGTVREYEFTDLDLAVYTVVVTAIGNAAMFYADTDAEGVEVVLGERVANPSAQIGITGNSGQQTIAVQVAPNTNAENVEKYTVELYLNGVLVGTKTVASTGGTVTWGPADNLARGLYHAVVWAVAEGVYLNSEEVTATTPVGGETEVEVTHPVAAPADVQTFPDRGEWGEILVTWKAPADADGIADYRVTLHKADGTTTDFTHWYYDGIEFGLWLYVDPGIYSVVVTAVGDADDHWTNRSAAAVPTVLAIPVTGPTDVQAERFDDSSILVEWTPPASNAPGYEHITGYRVILTPTVGTSLTPITHDVPGGISARSFVAGNVPQGEYMVTVIALADGENNEAGVPTTHSVPGWNQNERAWVAIAVPVGHTPVISSVIANNTDKIITVEWTGRSVGPQADNAGIGEYRVELFLGNERIRVDWVELGTDVLYEHSFTNLLLSGTYRAVVTAIGLDDSWTNVSSQSVNANVAITGGSIPSEQITAQPAPTLLLATPNSITIQWAANTNSAVTGYRIEYKAADAENWIVVANVDEDARTYTLTGLTQETGYVIRVIATGDPETIRESDSSELAVTTPKPTVTGVKVAANPAQPDTQLLVEWVQVPGANGYVIEVSTSPFFVSNSTHTVNVPGGGSGQFVLGAGNGNGSGNPALSPSTEYFVRVTAVFGEGAESEPGLGSARTETGQLPAPVVTATVATTNANRINVTWPAPPAPAPNITGYSITYQRYTPGETIQLHGSPETFHLGPDARTFNISDTAGHYIIVVRAFGPNGAESGPIPTQSDLLALLNTEGIATNATDNVGIAEIATTAAGNAVAVKPRAANGKAAPGNGSAPMNPIGPTFDSVTLTWAGNANNASYEIKAVQANNSVAASTAFGVARTALENPANLVWHTQNGQIVGVTISGLQAGQSYRFEVESHNASGTVAAGKVPTVNAKTLTPQQVAAVKPSLVRHSATSNSAQIQWAVPKSGVDGYEIMILGRVIGDNGKAVNNVVLARLEIRVNHDGTPVIHNVVLTEGDSLRIFNARTDRFNDSGVAKRNINNALNPLAGNLEFLQQSFITQSNGFLRVTLTGLEAGQRYTGHVIATNGGTPFVRNPGAPNETLQSARVNISTAAYRAPQLQGGVTRAAGGLNVTLRTTTQQPIVGINTSAPTVAKGREPVHAVKYEVIVYQGNVSAANIAAEQNGVGNFPRAISEPLTFDSPTFTISDLNTSERFTLAIYAITVDTSTGQEIRSALLRVRV